jgi:hypothetical protein
MNLLYCDPAMGLSKDPEKRAKQLETLAAGRRIRAERRAAGLPTKRSEDRRRQRVVDDDYKPTPTPDPDPTKPKKRQPSSRKRGGGDRASKEPAAAGGKRDVLRAIGDIIGA